MKKKWLFISVLNTLPLFLLINQIAISIFFIIFSKGLVIFSHGWHHSTYRLSITCNLYLIQWLFYCSVSGVWAGHHLQLREGLLHPGRIPDGRRSSRDVQSSRGSIYWGGWHAPRGTSGHCLADFPYYSCGMCFFYKNLCSDHRRWRNTWVNPPTEPREDEGVSHFKTWSKRFITPQHFYLVTNNDSLWLNAAVIQKHRPGDSYSSLGTF